MIHLIEVLPFASNNPGANGAECAVYYCNMCGGSRFDSYMLIFGFGYWGAN